MIHLAPLISRLPNSVPTIPWWVSVPDELHVCHDCHQRLSDEAMFHCNECGCDLCPECGDVPQATRRLRCSQCLDARR